MKKWVIVFLLLFLITGCTSGNEEEKIEEKVVEEVSKDENPLVYYRTEYTTIYSNSVVSVWRNNEYHGTITSYYLGQQLYGSTCSIDKYYYDALVIFVNNEFVTINEYLEMSEHFDVHQLYNYGLPIQCENNLELGTYSSVSPDTNPAYIQELKEVSHIDEYRVYEKDNNKFGCCIYTTIDFYESDTHIYKIHSGTLDREYFIFIDHIFYSLKDALNKNLISYEDVVSIREYLPKLHMIEVEVTK